MKRNLDVKKNVDEMIYQTLNYIAASKLSDAEVEALVYEILASVIVWNCDWNPEDLDMQSITDQVTETCANTSLFILRDLRKMVKEYGWRETC